MEKTMKNQFLGKTLQISKNLKQVTNFTWMKIGLSISAISTVPYSFNIMSVSIGVDVFQFSSAAVNYGNAGLVLGSMITVTVFLIWVTEQFKQLSD